MRSNSPFRLALVIFFAGLYLALVVLAVSRLARLDVLGGLPIGMAGLLAVVLRDFQSIWRFAKLPSKLIVAGAVLAGLVHVFATWVDSTALQLIGLGIFAAVWLARYFPRPRIGGLVVLIGFICMPVVFLKGTLLLSLQQLAAVMASRALDIAGVAHLRQGVILETTRGNLFVEEACSGMSSLLIGLTVCQVYFCWQRKGLVFSLAGLLCCSALLILGNCLRIFLIAWLFADHAINLTEGWKHELTGMAVYLLVLAMLPGLTGLLERIGILYVRWTEPWKEWLTRFSGRTGAVRRHAPRPIRRSLLEEIPKPLLVAVTLMMLAIVAEALTFRSGQVADPALDLDKLPSLSSIVMPSELDGWRLVPGEAEVSAIGKHTLQQRVWTFRKGRQIAWVAAGLPYDERHPLRLCYINRDWAIAGEGSLAGSSPFAYLELRSKENTRAPMLVCFDNFDLSSGRYAGGPPARLATRLATINARLKGKRSNREFTGRGPFCQVQVVHAGVTAHQSAGGAQTVRLLDAVREVLAAQLSENQSN